MSIKNRLGVGFHPPHPWSLVPNGRLTITLKQCTRTKTVTHTILDRAVEPSTFLCPMVLECFETDELTIRIYRDSSIDTEDGIVGFGQFCISDVLQSEEDPHEFGIELAETQDPFFETSAPSSSPSASSPFDLQPLGEGAPSTRPPPPSVPLPPSLPDSPEALSPSASSEPDLSHHTSSAPLPVRSTSFTSFSPSMLTDSRVFVVRVSVVGAHREKKDIRSLRSNSPVIRDDTSSESPDEDEEVIDPLPPTPSSSSSSNSLLSGIASMFRSNSQSVSGSGPAGEPDVYSSLRHRRRYFAERRNRTSSAPSVTRSSSSATHPLQPVPDSIMNDINTRIETTENETEGEEVEVEVEQAEAEEEEEENPALIEVVCNHQLSRHQWFTGTAKRITLAPKKKTIGLGIGTLLRGKKSSNTPPQTKLVPHCGSGLMVYKHVTYEGGFVDGFRDDKNAKIRDRNSSAEIRVAFRFHRPFGIMRQRDSSGNIYLGRFQYRSPSAMQDDSGKNLRIDQFVRAGKGALFCAESRSLYYGQFRDDLPDGKGMMEFLESGERYVGTWKGGHLQGKGSSMSIDGSFYFGHWVGGRKSGRGTMFLSNGSRMEGSWDRHRGVVNQLSVRDPVPTGGGGGGGGGMASGAGADVYDENFLRILESCVSRRLENRPEDAKSVLKHYLLWTTMVDEEKFARKLLAAVDLATRAVSRRAMVSLQSLDDVEELANSAENVQAQPQQQQHEVPLSRPSSQSSSLPSTSPMPSTTSEETTASIREKARRTIRWTKPFTESFFGSFILSSKFLEEVVDQFCTFLHFCYGEGDLSSTIRLDLRDVQRVKNRLVYLRTDIASFLEAMGACMEFILRREEFQTHVEPKMIPSYCARFRSVLLEEIQESVHDMLIEYYRTHFEEDSISLQQKIKSICLALRTLGTRSRFKIYRELLKKSTQKADLCIYDLELMTSFLQLIDLLDDDACPTASELMHAADPMLKVLRLKIGGFFDEDSNEVFKDSMRALVDQHGLELDFSPTDTKEQVNELRNRLKTSRICFHSLRILSAVNLVRDCIQANFPDHGSCTKLIQQVDFLMAGCEFTSHLELEPMRERELDFLNFSLASVCESLNALFKKNFEQFAFVSKSINHRISAICAGLEALIRRNPDSADALREVQALFVKLNKGTRSIKIRKTSTINALLQTLSTGIVRDRSMFDAIYFVFTTILDIYHMDSSIIPFALQKKNLMLVLSSFRRFLAFFQENGVYPLNVRLFTYWRDSIRYIKKQLKKAESERDYDIVLSMKTKLLKLQHQIDSLREYKGHGRFNYLFEILNIVISDYQDFVSEFRSWNLDRDFARKIETLQAELELPPEPEPEPEERCSLVCVSAPDTPPSRFPPLPKPPVADDDGVEEEGEGEVIDAETARKQSCETQVKKLQLCLDVIEEKDRFSHFKIPSHISCMESLLKGVLLLMELSEFSRQMSSNTFLRREFYDHLERMQSQLLKQVEKCLASAVDGGLKAFISERIKIHFHFEKTYLCLRALDVPDSFIPSFSIDFPYRGSLAKLNELGDARTIRGKMRVLIEFEQILLEEMMSISGSSPPYEEDEKLPIVSYIFLLTDLDHHVELQFIQDWCPEFSAMKTRYETFLNYVQSLDPYAQQANQLLTIVGNIISPLKNFIIKKIGFLKALRVDFSLKWFVHVLDYIYCHVGFLDKDTCVLDLQECDRLVEQLRDNYMHYNPIMLTVKFYLRFNSEERKFEVCFTQKYSPEIYKRIREQVTLSFAEYVV